MPAKSAKQFGFMQAAAHGDLKGVGGPSPSVAEDFVKKTPPTTRSKFASALMKQRTKKKGMSVMNSTFALALLVVGSLFGQSLQNPPSILGFDAKYFGDFQASPTNTSYYVQAVYPSGRSAIAGPITIGVPSSRSARNQVLVTWASAPGAIGYDVMVNTTATVPSGACNCALAVGITANSFTDNGQASLTYTTDNPNTLPVGMTVGSPAMQMTVQTAIDTGALSAAQMLNGLLVGTPTAAASYTTPTATALEAAMPSCVVGRTYPLWIKNTSSGANTITVLGGTSVTVSGTATIAQNAVREFLIYVTNCATPAITAYSLNTGAF